MIDTTSSLRHLVSAVAAGDVELGILDAAVANLGDRLDDLRDEALANRYADLELLLAEYTSGHLDRGDLFAELRQFAPVEVRTPATGGYVITSAATSVDSRVIRQAIHAVTDPFPAVGTRREVVRVSV